MTHLNAPAKAGDFRFLLAPVIARYSVWNVITEGLTRRNRRPAAIARLSDHQLRDIGIETPER